MNALYYVALIILGAIIPYGVSRLKKYVDHHIEHSVKHKYDKELETHKANLQRDYDVQVERLKSQLQIAAAEKSIKLTQVFEAQANIIAETYSKLVALLDAARDYTAPITYPNTPSMEDRHAVVAAKHKAFKDCYDPRKLYFPKATQLQIDAFLLKFVQVLRQFIDDVHQKGATHKAQTWEQTMSFMGKECTQIMEKLDSDFKTILGLMEEGKSNNP